MRTLKRALSAIMGAAIAAGCCPFPALAQEELVTSQISFEESVETIANPGAGYTNTPWYRLAPGEYKPVDTQGSLVLFFIYIGAYSSGANGERVQNGSGETVYTPGEDYELDESFFRSLRESFENCRKNGSMIAMRFRYDENGYDDPEPGSFDMVLRHIEQIKDSGLLEEYSDIIAYVETGMVGKWGEQHGGKYTSLDYKAQVLDAFVKAVPEPIPVTVRTPDTFAKWLGIERSQLADEEWLSGQELTQEQGYRLSQAYRVGLYNDGYMGSSSDLGTFADRNVETAWLNKQCETAYYGGEFSGNIEFAKQFDTYLPENAIPEMYRTHLSYINCNIFSLYKDYTFSEEYSVPGVDNSAYYGQSVFQFIRNHLGYRFVLRDAKTSATVPQGGDLQVELTVENTGFASPIPKVSASLILEREGSYITCPLPDVDANHWLSCTKNDLSQTVTIPGGLEPGKWNVYLKLQMGNNTVDQHALRSIRFANEGVWNASLGADLVGEITVAPSSSTGKYFGVKGGLDDESGRVMTVRGQVIPDGMISSDTEWTEEMLIGENGDNKVYMTADENNLYIMGQLPDTAEAPVYNIRLTREDGESYWLYYASNGYVYFNHEQRRGDSCKHVGRTVEFTIPLEMMGLSAGTEVKQVRLFLQDSANDWALLGDVYSERFTVPAGFRVYSGCTNIKLQEREAYIAAPVTLVEGAQYQWYLDGEAIEGATGETYAVYGKTGTYSVKITAPDGAEKTVDTLRVTEIRSSDLLYGDANDDGKVDLQDAVAILQNVALSAKYPLTEKGQLQADVDEAEGISGIDALVIQKVDAKLIKQEQLPLRK